MTAARPPAKRICTVDRTENFGVEVVKSPENLGGPVDTATSIIQIIEEHGSHGDIDVVRELLHQGLSPRDILANFGIEE